MRMHNPIPIPDYGKHPGLSGWKPACLLGIGVMILMGSPARCQASDLPAPDWNKIKSVQVQVPSAAGVGGDESLVLRGADDRRQVLVDGYDADGLVLDISRHVTYSLTPRGVVEIDETGRLTPVADGSTLLTILDPLGGNRSSMTIHVGNVEHSNPVHFVNDVIPVFTKLGCNGGGCHGKSGGQNGFRLSLLGFEPTEDYEWLVKEGRLRRIIPAAPRYSLLLTKATGEVPHGGGSRLVKDSEDYHLLVEWIRQGMDFGDQSAPTLKRIEVTPKERTMQRLHGQQLVVVAHYSDGSKKDVTRSALYESNVKDLARTDSVGFVTVGDQPGDVAIMVRFQGKVDVFRAMIPLGVPISDWPPVANFIDSLVHAKLEKMGMPPSGMVDNATFLRRVTLDLTGRLPTLDELSAFEESNAPDKRSHVIDQLLNSKDYADFFASKWSALLRNKRNRETDKHGNFAFHRWMSDALFRNRPFDEFVSAILTARGEIRTNPAVAWYREVNETTEMLEDTAQLFLGTRIQCAQCHHHPFERWSQKDYYQFSAFFSTVKKRPGLVPGEDQIFHHFSQASATNKKSGEKVLPAPLGGQTINVPPEEDPREYLAGWIRQPENPYFARTLVNRYWKHFFGVGLVEPEDDVRATNPATNPELLDALAESFVQSGYDLKQLIRTLCHSSTYQLSSIPNPDNLSDRQHFSRFYPKRLQAEVLMDSINDVLRSTNGFAGVPDHFRATQLPDNSFNKDSYFLTVFGKPDNASACECERTQNASLAQSLHLINSPQIQEKLAHPNGLAAAFSADQNQPDAHHIQTLYRMAFSRMPNPEELSIALNFLELKTRSIEAEELSHARQSAYEDIIWAILNTKEFLFNH